MHFYVFICYLESRLGMFCYRLSVSLTELNSKRVYLQWIGTIVGWLPYKMVNGENVWYGFGLLILWIVETCCSHHRRFQLKKRKTNEISTEKQIPSDQKTVDPYHEKQHNWYDMRYYIVKHTLFIHVCKESGPTFIWLLNRNKTAIRIWDHGTQ